MLSIMLSGVSKVKYNAVQNSEVNNVYNKICLACLKPFLAV
jgi:hypothetical protein